MKIKSEIIWATLLVGTAAMFFYLGAERGALKNEEALESNIKEKTEKITVLEDKVQQLSEELTSRGIYSYPQANVAFKKGDSAAKVLIILNGKDAIPNLEVEKKLITNHSGGTDNNFEELEPKGTTIHIGTLSSHNPVAFEIKRFKEDIGMDLIFKSEREQWHQYIKTRKTPDGEIKTFWVITNKHSEVIDKHIDEGFPTDSNGNLVLEENRKVKYSDIAMNSVFRP